MLPVPKIPNQQPTAPAPKQADEPIKPKPKPAPAAPTPIKWIWVLRDVLILFCLTYWGSKVVGFSSKALNDSLTMEKLATFNIILMTFGFFLMAFLVRENRLRHFWHVAILLWVLGDLPNFVFSPAPLAILLTNWLASAPLIAFAAMVGGSAGSALFQSKRKTKADVT